GNFLTFGAGLKADLSDKLSIAVLFDQPFGSDITYDGIGATTELGGTTAIANTVSYTALLRYKFSDRISAHGGLRLQQADGNIALSGLAYGPAFSLAGFGATTFNGYSVELGHDFGVGFVLGAAYEIPDIALRVALTYNSAITHEFDTVESSTLEAALNGTSVTEVETPQSINLDFQSGIAKDTLVFGSVRWAEWSEFKIDPELFTPLAGGGLVDLDDSVTYTIGVGRRFTEQFSASVSYTYEAEDDDDLVSPLAPTNGLNAITLAGRWTTPDGVRISGGLRYSMLGDARPETGTPDVERADFTDNSALTLGLRVGFSF
ncbi:MAG: outer membrane protein transport protein, partial [Pseudomonadota bacterium]